MHKPNFCVAVNSVNTQLPRTFDVRNYNVCVSDISFSGLCNIPKCTIAVHADNSIYDILIPACKRQTPQAILDLLIEKLELFAEITLEVHDILRVKCHENVSKIVIPEKLRKIIGLSNQEIVSTQTAEKAVDPQVLVRRIFVASHIAEPTVVNGVYVPLIYCGPSENKVVMPTYFPVSMCQMSSIDLTVFDSNLEPISLDFTSFNVMMHFQSP